MGETIIPHPLTFHVEIKQDAATQQQAQDLQMFFASPDIVNALNIANPRLVHFARILHIPNNQPFQPDGIFGVQVVIVYDGEEITPLLEFMWNTPGLRGLFQELSRMEVPLPKPGLLEDVSKDLKKIFEGKKTAVPTPDTFEGFCGYIQYNNLTPLHTELHKGYNLSVDDIVNGFPPPPAVSTGSQPA